MEIRQEMVDTALMTEDAYNDLFELAVVIAHAAFKPATDDHVTEVYERLVWNETHGLGHDGAATLH